MQTTLVIGVAWALVSACSPKGKTDPGQGGGSSSGTSRVSLGMPAASSSSSSFSAQAPAQNYFVPSTLGDFDCFAVNVIGPDIKTVPACGGDSQMGIATGFVSRGGVLQLDVPMGKGRTFQVWGFSHSSYCPDVINMLVTPKGGMPAGMQSTGFLLGQQTVDVLSRSMTINVPVSFTFGVNPVICGSIPFPVTSIDSAVIDKNPLFPALNNNDITSSLNPVCLYYSTTARSPIFQLYQDNVLTAAAGGACPAAPAGSYVQRFTPGGPGNHTFRVQTTDNTYSLVDQNPPSFSWLIDTTPPVLTISSVSPGRFSPKSNKYFTTTFSPTALLNDSKAGIIKVQWTQIAPPGPASVATTCANALGAGAVNCPITPTLNLVPNSEFTVTFTARDVVNNASLAISTSVVVDLTPPTLTLTPSGGWLMGGTFTGVPAVPQSAVVVAQDPFGDIDSGSFMCQVDANTSGLCPTPAGVAFTGVSQRGGKHSLTATVQDYANNQATPLSSSVFIDNLLGQTAIGRLFPDGSSLVDESTTLLTTANLPGATGVALPGQSALDIASGLLFVADTNNNRVLVFKWDPSVNGLVSRKAVGVYGQYDFVASGSGASNVTQQGVTYTPMLNPIGIDIATIPNRKLFVSDSGNHRILRFDLSSASFGNGLDVPAGFYNKTADYFLGQATLAGNLANRNGLSSNGGGLTNQGMNNPLGIAYMNDRLYVADQLNCRIAVWDQVDSSAAPPTTVLKQFTANGVTVGLPWLCPNGAAVASQTNLPSAVAADAANDAIYVADTNYHRVLKFNPASTLPDASAATDVFGQPNMTTSVPSNTNEFFNSHLSSTLGNPTGIAVVKDVLNRVFIAVSSLGTGTSHKVKFYDGNTADANYKDLVNVWNTSGTAGASRAVFNVPSQLGFDKTSETLFVGDKNNSRIGVFRITTVTDNMSMVDEVGHTDLNGSLRSFVATTSNNPNETNLNSPTYAVADVSFLRLYVSDTFNNRVLVYTLDPITYKPSRVASSVIGVPTFFDGNPTLDSTLGVFPVAANTLFSPKGLALDNLQRLYVVDSLNNRVLRFPTNTPSLPASPTADLVLGQPDMETVVPGAGLAGLHSPTGIAYDFTNNWMYVTDTLNFRVLAYDLSTTSNGMAAFANVGTTGVQGTSSTRFWNPSGLAFNPGSSSIPNKGIFVTDSDNTATGGHRVMYFDFSTAVKPTLRQDATACYGHHMASPGNITTICNSNARNDGGTLATNGTFGLNYPQGVAFSPAGNRLYVSDTGNDRVVVYDVTSSGNQPGVLDVATSNGIYHAVGAQDLVSSFNPTTATSTGLKAPVGILYLQPAIGTNLLYIIDNSWHRIGVYEVP